MHIHNGIYYVRKYRFTTTTYERKTYCCCHKQLLDWTLDHSFYTQWATVGKLLKWIASTKRKAFERRNDVRDCERKHWRSSAQKLHAVLPKVGKRDRKRKSNNKYPYIHPHICMYIYIKLPLALRVRIFTFRFIFV